MITWTLSDALVKPIVDNSDEDLQRQGISVRCLVIIDDSKLAEPVSFGRYNQRENNWIVEGYGTRFKIRAWSNINLL